MNDIVIIDDKMVFKDKRIGRDHYQDFIYTEDSSGKNIRILNSIPKESEVNTYKEIRNKKFKLKKLLSLERMKGEDSDRLDIKVHSYNRNGLKSITLCETPPKGQAELNTTCIAITKNICKKLKFEFRNPLKAKGNPFHFNPFRTDYLKKARECRDFSNDMKKLFKSERKELDIQMSQDKKEVSALLEDTFKGTDGKKRMSHFKNKNHLRGDINFIDDKKLGLSEIANGFDTFLDHYHFCRVLDNQWGEESKEKFRELPKSKNQEQ